MLLTTRYISRLQTLLLLALLALPDTQAAAQTEPGPVVSDFGKLYPTQVLKIVRGSTTADLVAVIDEARERGLRVSISGKRHSQGGHAFYEGAVVLDMTAYNAILRLDTENRIITVQSGATWADVQEYVHPHKLAVKVMQSSNIFTIGGSLSANVHGRDPNYGPLIETVRAFRLLTADSEILNVSRTENAELFRLVIGGYGLFGVILDVDLELTDDLVYEKRTTKLSYTAYADWFARTVANDRGAGLHYGRLSVVRNDGFLRDMYATTHHAVDAEPEDGWALEEERYIRTARFFYGLARKHDWGKALSWRMLTTFVDRPGRTSYVTRNQAMRPPVTFLEHESGTDTDILQEYFIPVAQFAAFTDALRAIVIAHDINLLNVTVRYVAREDESFLPYAREDCFALVLDINQGLSADARAEAERWTRELVDAAAAVGGTYYLTYQLHPSSEQIRAIYPRIDSFFTKKGEYDSRRMFMNSFYARYALD